MCKVLFALLGVGSRLAISSASLCLPNHRVTVAQPLLFRATDIDPRWHKACGNQTSMLRTLLGVDTCPSLHLAIFVTQHASQAQGLERRRFLNWDQMLSCSTSRAMGNASDGTPLDARSPPRNPWLDGWADVLDIINSHAQVWEW